MTFTYFNIKTIRTTVFIVLFFLSSVNFIYSQNSISPTDAKIHIEGSNYMSSVSSSELKLHRHSDAVYAGTKSANLFDPAKARSSTGIIIKFKTSSPTFDVKFKILEADKPMKSVFSVFQNDVFDKSVNFAKTKVGTAVVVPVTSKGAVGEEVIYKITLPLWTDIHFLGIDLENGHDLVAFVDPAKPIYVAYGNSITHGRGQNNTYETYPYILSELSGYELFNVAVGGGKTSQVMADMLAADFTKIDVMTILIGYNDLFGQKKTPAVYKTRYTNFLNTVRAAHPNTEIFCINLTYTTNTANANGTTPDEYRAVVRTIVSDRKTAGDANIYLIEGGDITDINDLNNPPPGGTDAVHLSVSGASNLANALYAEMNSVLAIEDQLNNADDGLISIYPNPAKGSIQIKSKEELLSLSVIDVMGREMISVKKPQRAQVLDINSLKFGVYLIKYKTKQGSNTIKFIKQ